jgi:hypothetical protein
MRDKKLEAFTISGGTSFREWVLKASTGTILVLVKVSFPNTIIPRKEETQ